MACNKVPQLLDDGVNELLLVTLILTELGEHVVFPTCVLHPTERETGKEERKTLYKQTQNRVKEKMMLAPCISLSDLNM